MQTSSPISLWYRTPRLRRALALGSLVLSVGGIVLLRSPAGAEGLPHIVMPPDGATRTSFAGPSLSGTVALSHTKIREQNGRIFADISLTAAKGASQEVRAPVSLAIVLDTSGSMSGEKIEEAKRSAIRLVRDMRDSDEVSFVRYSDSSEVLQSLSRVGDVRESLIRRIEGIQASGGTNIPSGLRLGKGTLRGARSSYVHRVVLMSDGLDSSRDEAGRLAREAAEEGTTISSLGIGLDFDEGYMSSVASAGRGNFAFVKDGASLATFLEKELVESSHTVVQNAVVRITLPAGLDYVRASGAEATLEGRELTVRAGSLFAGDERRILLELRTSEACEECAANDSGRLRGVYKLPVSANWTVVGGDQGRANASPLSLATTISESEANASLIPEVYSRAMSVLASRRQMEAAEAFSRGEQQRAQAIVDQNTRELRAAASVLPPKAAAPLQAQAGRLDLDREAFDKGVGSDEAKAASKSAMQREFNNAYRNGWK